MTSENRSRGSTRGGAVLLAEIDLHRLCGDYTKLRAASHALPSSSVAQAQSLRNLILGECELEQYVLQVHAKEQQKAAQSVAKPATSPHNTSPDHTTTDEDDGDDSGTAGVSPDQQQSARDAAASASAPENTGKAKAQETKARNTSTTGAASTASKGKGDSSSGSSSNGGGGEGGGGGGGAGGEQEHTHSLQVACRYFQDVMSTNQNDNDTLEARLLLARSYLMEGRTEDAENIYHKFLPTPETASSLPLRRALVVSHAYACRASSHPDPQRMQRDCFDVFMSAMLTAQEQRVVKTEGLVLTTLLSDTAHAVLSHVQRLAANGAVPDAVSACRQIIGLQALVPFEFRVEVLVLLAETHMDHPEAGFLPPTPSSATQSNRRVSRLPSATPVTPESAEEDALLALLIAETELLVRSSRALENADVFVRLYDAITALLLICGQHTQAVEILERAIAATYGAENFHLWMLLGAELERMDNHKHAIAVYKQCALDHASKHGLRACQALTAAAKAHMYLGTQRDTQDAFVAHLRDASAAATSKEEKQAIHRLFVVAHLQEYRSLHDASRQAEALKEAKAKLSRIEDDMKTADDMYLEALTLAHARATDDAVGAVWSCLSLCPTHRHGLQLFALLLTAKRDFTEALTVCHRALKHFPTDVVAMRIVAHAALALDGPRGALLACKTFFASINTMMREAMRMGRSFVPLGPSSLSDETLSGDLLQIDDAESAISIQSGRVSTISGSNASAGESGSRTSIDGTTMSAASIFAEMWLDCAGWFLDIGQPDDSDKCVQQARQLAGMHPAVDRFLGARARQDGDLKEAVERLEQALTFDEHDVPSLIELGMCQHALGEADIAENRLHHALRIDPTNAEAHRALGKLLQERGATDASVQCMLHALQLGAHRPVLPYHTLSCCPFLS